MDTNYNLNDYKSTRESELKIREFVNFQMAKTVAEVANDFQGDVEISFIEHGIVAICTIDGGHHRVYRFNNDFEVYRSPNLLDIEATAILHRECTKEYKKDYLKKLQKYYERQKTVNEQELANLEKLNDEAQN